MQLSAGRLAGMVGGTRRLREVAPPPLASSHGKPAVCLLCCAESACSPQLWCSAAFSAPLFSFCLCCFLLFSSILTPAFFLFSSSLLAPLFPLCLRLPPTGSTPLGPPPLPAHTPHPQPHHPVARIMTLLTTQTHGGSGYGPAKSSQSPTSITSLAPLSRLGRVGETER